MKQRSERTKRFEFKMRRMCPKEEYVDVWTLAAATPVMISQAEDLAGGWLPCWVSRNNNYNQPSNQLVVGQQEMGSGQQARLAVWLLAYDRQERLWGYLAVDSFFCFDSLFCSYILVGHMIITIANEVAISRGGEQKNRRQNVVKPLGDRHSQPATNCCTIFVVLFGRCKCVEGLHQNQVPG